MKDTKHIRRDFHLAAWVIHQGWDLRVSWGVGGGQKNSEIQPDLVCEILTRMPHTTAPLFGSRPPSGLEVGPKGQISLNLYYKVSFKDF